jgi:prevent-host-death family protein
MKEVGAFEAKNRLGTLLDWVEAGEEVVITRHGRPVARLVPAVATFDRVAARRVADEIVADSRGLGLGGVTLRELIAEGRKG